MLVLLHVVIGCGILFRFKVYQNLYSELKSSPLFLFYFCFMRKWDFYNACFEVATRCNVLFCKSFIYRVLQTSDGVTISAQSLCQDDGEKQGLEVFFSCYYATNSIFVTMTDMSNNQVVSREDYDKFAIGAIVYSLGHDVVASYSDYSEIDMEFQFFLRNDLSYIISKDYYEYLSGKTIGSEETDYPLLKHLKTEFETEICLSNENKELITDVKKNGELMFNDFLFHNSHDGWCMIRIEKGTSDYSINTCGYGLLNEPYNCRKVMAYVGELAYAKILWSHIKRFPKKAGQKPCFEFYFSKTICGRPSKEIIRLERFRCYGLNMDELRGALETLAKQIRVPMPRWETYASLKIPY